MRKLNSPTVDPAHVYDICVGAVPDVLLRATYIGNRPQIVQAVAAFDAATATTSWMNLPRVPRGNPGVVVAGALTKGHLTELYSTYMVGCGGASRKIYDDILVAAEGLCPFCGGLGQVRTLDHYLPKANFPQYSVLPANLVPCCRDCNTGKSNAFPLVMHQQPIHPYLDDDKYFYERWITAEAAKTNPVTMKFKCTPPQGWADTEKRRAGQHFIDYGFAARFSIQAGAELSRVVDLRKGSLRPLSPADFKAYLVENAESAGFDLNGWNRTMYAGLAEADWFLDVDFSDPDWHLLL